MKLKLDLEQNCNQFDLEDVYDLFKLEDVKALQADLEFIHDFLGFTKQVSRYEMKPEEIKQTQQII